MSQAGDGAGSAATRQQHGVDTAETGIGADGQPQRLDRRLYAQLLVFTGSTDSPSLIPILADSNVRGALYQDLNDPRGVGVVTLSEDPATFVNVVRPMVNTGLFAQLRPRTDYSMLGRTYSLGYERDLEDVLLRRPLQRVENPQWPWAVWYPIRRSGAFEQLDGAEQRSVLMEHADIGRAFAASNIAHDVRLSCHGLHADDADFITGLFSPRLHPLSLIVQRMRKTVQTSRYLERLGPFFVGHVLWQSTAATTE